MTRDELIEAIRGRLKARDRDDYDAGFRAGIETSAELAEQLDSPTAMAWQDEPSGNGWYWVSLSDLDWTVAHVTVATKGWRCNFGEVIEPLNGRRVCPVPAPPALPKRGDA